MGEQPSRKIHPSRARGKWAVRFARFSQRHPKLYAARHVLVEGIGILIAIVGVSALVSGLIRSWLPAFDWSWLAALPRIEPPEWLRYIDPLSWLVQLLPDWQLPDWDLPALGWTKYLVPLVIAGLVGVWEVRKGRAGHPPESQGHHTPQDDHEDAARGTPNSEDTT